MTYTTTARHFTLFRKYVFKWQKLLGLTQYEIDTEHKAIDETTLGDSDSEPCGAAVVRLNRTWHRKPTGAELESLAFHEVLHILFAELRELGKSRSFSMERWDQAEEEVVRRLEFLHREDS